MSVPERLFKYRGQLERDVPLIEANCIWSASIQSLNDPWEAYSINNIPKEAKWAGKLFGASQSSIQAFASLADETHKNLIDRTGVLSLSSNPLDEVLWAHYADSHRGICIEYDTCKLLDNFSYDGSTAYQVQYSKEVPSLGLRHVFRSGPEKEFIVDALCHKSSRWQHEAEYRVLFERQGRISHHHEAVTAIYFGSRIGKDVKRDICLKLSNRGIKFFDIINRPRTYEFISAPSAESTAGLPATADGLSNLPMTIAAIKKRVNFKRVEIDVLLETRLSANDLKNIHGFLARTVFSTAERHCVNFRTRASDDVGIPWAVVHNQQQDVEVTFNPI